VEPVRVKYWGLIWLGRRGYLLLNGIGWLLVVAILVAAVHYKLLPPFRWPSDPPVVESPGVAAFLINHLYDFVILGFVAQMLDAVVFYRLMSKKEAQLRDGAGPR
jgi:hypothetical protein